MALFPQAPPLPIAFLFPTSDLNPKKVNELFADQYEALKADHPCALYRDGKVFGVAGRVHPLVFRGHRVVYRGWMLNAAEYTAMVDAIYTMDGVPFTSLSEYLLCHQLPNWYHQISGLTMKTEFFAPDCDSEAELRRLNWPGYFIKDHVKSNKSVLGSVAHRPEDGPAIVVELAKYRGGIEGGLCVREYCPVTDEWRVFVREGEFNFVMGIPRDYLDLVMKVRNRIMAPFYSIDIGRDRTGKPVVVEIGDGQVSDIVGWPPDMFATIWKN